MNIVSTSNTVDTRGMSVDMTDRATQLYVGAAVVGATAVVGSVAITTIAAPALVLVPAAIAGGMVATGRFIANNDAPDADTITPVAV
jgi:hypothetical protein